MDIRKCSPLPARWSPCHLCGRSECFLSAQSSAAASFSPETSVVSSASRPSAASPWIWRSAARPGSDRAQDSHSWIVLRNATRKKSVEVSETFSYIPPTHKPNEQRHSPRWRTHAALRSCTALPLFSMNMYQPIRGLDYFCSPYLHPERKLLLLAE